MKYVNAFIIKFVMTSVVLFVFLNVMNNIPLTHVLMISFIISSLGFILGDLIILPAFENWGATITDFFLVVITIRLYGMTFFVESLPTLASIGVVAIIIAAGEVFLHMYVNRTILNVVENVNTIDFKNLQTEFSEEFDSKNDRK